MTYLDESDPFYVHRDFPKLTTPQWIGEPGVDAIVILAIDDMREIPKWENYLRPILTRLKQIDGRAPVSIMTVNIDPQLPHLQTWLKEGLSLEVHTLTHPCPLLANSNFVAAADTYHDCVELLNKIPGNHPVAFRMPCCDSMNSPSPRFYAEMFNRTNRAGQFLTIDSSVMNILTPNDPLLPRELVVDGDGREKFRKYLPAQTNATTRVSMGSFSTTIDDYPYPYVIGKLCWEFPAMAPSDWEAQNLHGVNNPRTIADWEAALDATVIKQGTFTFIFHPHGWIKPDQIVEFIDYAVSKYGKRVKFLNFREAQERLDKNLLAGQSLRAAGGQDNGVRLLDVNNDGYLDVVIANQRERRTRVWNTTTRAWSETSFPTEIAGVRFGVVDADGRVLAVKAEQAGQLRQLGAWLFDGKSWVEDQSRLNGLTLEGQPILTVADGSDRGVRLRDVDNDGRCELIVGNEKQNVIFAWSLGKKTWTKLASALPAGTSIVNANGEDNGLRFVDVNEDGFDDLLFSNENDFSLHLFIATPKPNLGWERGWTFKLRSGTRGGATVPVGGGQNRKPSSATETVAGTSATGTVAPPVGPGSASSEIPMMVRSGPARDNGAWFHSRHLWVQNEDVAHLPDKVDRRSFTELLTGDEAPPKSPQDSLTAMRVRPGFKVELVASEPLVIDPVAFDWGAEGKLWVVEMRDYPSGNGGKGGAIKCLEDTDGDGRYDKATVFLDGLNFPNGIMPWR
ncbi:MAG TPA: FG-GAP-like repeat-containing protein, partial [Candidatus Eisenbacteria bacterium]|nr:FG-GAP-like repeat-containing protein [Candidatus Eisenbacteria bacterium]